MPSVLCKFTLKCSASPLTAFQIPYRRYYRTQLADAFDIYITIRNEVHQRVMVALGRGEPDWRAMNSCPACAVQVFTAAALRDTVTADTVYLQVEGEDPPTVTRMVCIDGNNSLKRLATAEGRQRGDARIFQSDYILPRDFVDQYANEVPSRQRQSKPDLPNDDDHDHDDAASFPGVDNGGYPTDGAADHSSTPCASNWTAAVVLLLQYELVHSLRSIATGTGSCVQPPGRPGEAPGPSGTPSRLLGSLPNAVMLSRKRHFCSRLLGSPVQTSCRRCNSQKWTLR